MPHCTVKFGLYEGKSILFLNKRLLFQNISQGLILQTQVQLPEYSMASMTFKGKKSLCNKIKKSNITELPLFT